jgi:hypothetical protein
VLPSERGDVCEEIIGNDDSLSTHVLDDAVEVPRQWRNPVPHPVHAVTTQTAQGTQCRGRVEIGTVRRRPRAQPRGVGASKKKPRIFQG